jgi:glycosyltransferase-like protein
MTIVKSPQSLRIALFTYSTKPRGSVVHTLELAEALTSLGHDVCVYALSKDGSGFDRPLSCHRCLIPTQPAPADMDALIRQRIQEFVDYLIQNSPDYDIYHAQDCLSANALATLRQQKLISHFVRTVHHVEEYSSIYLQECQDKSIRAADLCVCVSDRCQLEVKEHFNIHAPRVSNGVNLQHFLPVSNELKAFLKKRLGLHGSPIYLTVGGVEPRKNSINLLLAFSLIKQEMPNAQLVIAGGATLFDYQSYRDRFFALVKELDIHLGESLILPGVLTREELCALYQVADAFVFPSTKEGWGLVALEAIASRLPLIASNLPPFTEFLNPDQALLVDPQSPNAIAQAMKDILQPTLANFLIEQSQSILSTYTWEASARMHLEHYQQLLCSS